MKELPSEEEEIPFRIKTYKKKELACMYNPNITPGYSVNVPLSKKSREKLCFT